MPSREDLFQGFTIGEWEILPGQGVLRRGTHEERPEPKVLDVLLSLATRDGNLTTRDDLVEDVWGGRPVGDEPINRCLSQLRGHLGDRERPHRYIETLQKRGYRLMQPVVLHDTAAVGDSGRDRSPVSSGWIMAALLVMVAIVAVIFVTRPSSTQDPEIRSIAILPIDNLSGDPANQYIVDGIRNVLAQRLAQSPGLTLKNARVSYDQEPSQIAEALGVDSVLTGAVQLEGSTLKVTYLVSRGDDNVTIGSGEVNGELDSIFSLQERLATQVRHGLTGASSPELVTLYTPDSKAYNSYLRGIYAFEHRGEADNLEHAIALFQESIELDKYYGPAYLSLATAYALLPDYRDSPLEESARLAIQTVERGVAVDSNIEDAAGAVYGNVFHKQKKWSESEASYRRAVSAKVVDSNAFNWYSRMLASVGRLDDSLRQALAAAAIDPDNAVINSRVATAHTWLGNNVEAHEFFRRANALGAGGKRHLLAYALLLVREQQYDRAAMLATEATRTLGIDGEWVEPVFAAFRDPALSSDALRALERAKSVGALAPEVEIVARTAFGDLQGAMNVARRLEEPGERFEMDLLFTQELKSLRDHPDFLPLLERLGVTAYWDKAGCVFDGWKALCTTG